VNNHETAEKLFRDAEEYFEDSGRSYQRKSWNQVVRRSQEVIELSLKALLKMMGVEYPKEHDIGEIFVNACRKKQIEIEEGIAREIIRISSRLTDERAPSFYWEKVYSRQNAEEARQGAEKVLSFTRELLKKLKGE
jgi:HEPN domain-containing protein